MRPLKFEPFLRLGIDQIDNQHEELVGMINATQAVIRDDKDPTELILILNNLNDFAIRHFTTEEELMRLHDYPGLEKHKKQHDISLDKTFEFDSGLLMTDPDAGRALFSLLRNWLLEHIETDKEMADFLKQRGLR